jgi:hypothetical protein
MRGVSIMHVRTSALRARPTLEALEDRLLLAFDAVITCERPPGQGTRQVNDVALESWSLGQSAPTSPRQKPNYHLVVKAIQPPAAPPLFGDGEHFTKVKITLVKSGTPTEKYLQMTMRKVMVHQYPTGNPSLQDYVFDFSNAAWHWTKPTGAPHFWQLKDGDKAPLEKSQASGPEP